MADYYVSPTGLDTNNGSISAPFRNPQKGADVAQPGDTVWLYSGTYGDNDSDSYIIRTKRSGSGGSPIVFRNVEGESPVLDAGNASVTGIYVDPGYTNFQFIGLEITGCGVNGAAIWGAWVLFQKCHVHHNGRRVYACDWSYGRNGIFCSTKSSRVTIDQCNVHTNGRLDNTCDFQSSYWRLDHNLYLQGCLHTVKNSIIWDNWKGSSCKCDGYHNTTIGASEFTHTFLNNIFGPNTVPLENTTYVYGAIGLFNNFQVDATWGVAQDPRIFVANNVFIDTGIAGSSATDIMIRFQAGSPSQWFTGNVVKNNVSTTKWIVNPTVYSTVIAEDVGNLLDTDPMLADEVSLFLPEANSPVFGAGDPSLINFDYDFLGNPRIGTENDAGAYALSSIEPDPPVQPPDPTPPEPEVTYYSQYKGVDVDTAVVDSRKNATILAAILFPYPLSGAEDAIEDGATIPWIPTINGVVARAKVCCLVAPTGSAATFELKVGGAWGAAFTTVGTMTVGVGAYESGVLTIGDENAYQGYPWQIVVTADSGATCAGAWLLIEVEPSTTLVSPEGPIFPAA